MMADHAEEEMTASPSNEDLDTVEESTDSDDDVYEVEKIVGKQIVKVRYSWGPYFSLISVESLPRQPPRFHTRLGGLFVVWYHSVAQPASQLYFPASYLEAMLAEIMQNRV